MPPTTDGRYVGTYDGSKVGLLDVGRNVGCAEGCLEGRELGCREGWRVGCSVGCLCEYRFKKKIGG